MKRIDDLIAMHDEIKRKEEPIIIRKLEMVNSLYDECENSDDKIFFDEIINNLSDIIKMQKEMIEELNDELRDEITYSGYLESLNEANDNGVFESDEQLQSSFIRYFTYSVKKPLSSYTLNDYCSRLRNLWLTFCESEDADLEDIYISKEQCSSETPLLNVYNNVQTLRFFVDKKNKGADNKKKWANAGAALSKLEEFIKENNK